MNVKPIRYKLANRVIEKWHYLGYSPSFVTVNLVLQRDNEIIGVAMLGKPHARLEDQKHTFELYRFCLLVQEKNLASQFLSKIHKYVKVNFPHIKRIISYASTKEGHEGIIYKASNYHFIKTTPPRKSFRSLWSGHDRPGRNADPSAKHKFEYILRG